jgi:hypothetical protein
LGGAFDLIFDFVFDFVFARKNTRVVPHICQPLADVGE